MAAYLQTTISGNQSFGGYLSVDGEKAFAITHDMTYEIAPGQHCLIVYSTSNFERASGKVQAFTHMHTSSSGAVLDSIGAASAIKALGDSWQIDVVVDDGDLIELKVLSKGTKLVGDPMYAVRELDDETRRNLEARFEEWRNTPIRNKKQMTIGAVLVFCGIFGATNAISGATDDLVSALLVMVGLVALGGFLFYRGFQKKIRR